MFIHLELNDYWKQRTNSIALTLHLNAIRCSPQPRIMYRNATFLKFKTEKEPSLYDPFRGNFSLRIFQF